MSRVRCADVSAKAGSRVTIAGWLHNQRKLSNVSFLPVRDGSGIAQVVLEAEEARGSAAELLPETVVEVEGDVVAVEGAPGGAELHRAVVRVVSAVAVRPPVELRRPVLREQPATQLAHAAIALRHPRRRAVLRVAAAAVAGFRQALEREDFVEVHTPKIVGTSTESGANVFAVDYFGTRAYLAQSPQLYKQVLVGVFERVYEVGPVFRAEPHETTRHLAQYVSLDAELGFIRDHHDVMHVVTTVVRSMVGTVVRSCKREVDLLHVELPEVSHPFPAIDFPDAQRLVEELTGEPAVGEPDLAPAHERALGEWAQREHGSDFLFVTGYPMAKRPFYTHPRPSAPEYSNSFDLLFRGVEIVTGGQRLHRYEDYVEALGSARIESYEGYVEAFRHGMPPHGGFAIGLERFTAGLVGAGNVREATPFPRDRGRVRP